VDPRNHELPRWGPDPPIRGEILSGKALSAKQKPTKRARSTFFYNGIRTSEKLWTKCTSVAGNYVEK